MPILLVTEDGGHGAVFPGMRAAVAHSWHVLRANRDVATWLAANTAWEGAFVVLVFLVSVAGGAVLTLAWGLLFQLMPDDERGTVAGLATTTKGLCLVIRPLAAGAAIDILGPTLESTEGYQVLWPVLSIPILLAIPLVARLARDERRS